MSDDRHVFRLYAVDGDSLYSPYVYSEEPQAKMGETHRAEDASHEAMVDNVGGRLLHKGKLYPRSDVYYGFSVIGRSDPRYSIYTVDNPFVDASDTMLEAMDSEIASRVPESTRHKQSNLLKGIREVGQ